MTRWITALLLFAGACAPPLPPEAAPMHIHHTIDYIELGATDLGEAKRFYTAAFGWAFNDYGPAYCGIRGAEGEVGGIAQVDEVQPGGPLVVLYSENLEASVAAVESAGGEIVKPIFEFPGGRRFEFRDPSGNRLAVWGR